MEDKELMQEILKELQRSRRFAQRSTVAALVVLVAVTAYFGSITAGKSGGPWSPVLAELHRGDYDSALMLGKRLAAKSPSYYYGHEYLGMVYLAKGDLVHAEKEYAWSYELFPSQEDAHILKEIRSRLAMSKPSGVLEIDQHP
jgi:hypothetical protein